MPPDPPVPVLATWGPPFLRVTFDQDLQPGLVDPGNWFMAFGNLFYHCNIANIAAGVPRVVRASMFVHGGIVGPNSCWYYPPPFDVISVKGVPADRFEPFPVT